MASQPLHQPYIPPARPAARPNIRVVFSNGAAAMAVQRRLAEMPAAVRDATLDDLASAEAAAPINPPAEADNLLPRHLRTLLNERNTIAASVGNCPDLTDAAAAVAFGDISRLEDDILGIVADTPDDAIVQLIAIAQMGAAGQAVAEEEAVRVLSGARHHFGVGYAAGLDQTIPVPAKNWMPDGYDRFMGGPFVVWQKAYQAYVTAKLERRMYETATIAPLSDRYEAVRAIWPISYDFAANPVAQAAIDAVSYDSAEERYNELVGIEHDAHKALLLLDAPSPVELAIKLKLFVEGDLCEYRECRRFLEVMLADARRFGRLGAFPQSDGTILDAFAGRRRETAFWLSDRDRPATIAEEEASEARTLAAEEQIWSTRANTIDGVVIKLRTLFPQICGTDWSERAAADPHHPAFQEGIKAADDNAQALWAAITDLARIGGINLAEQGA